MNQELREAVSALVNHGRVLRAIVTVAENIKSVEDIERLTGEANARLKKAEDDLAVIRADVAAARDQKRKADEAVRLSRLKIGEAEYTASQIIEKAKENAASIIKQAETRADSLISMAQASAGKSAETAEEKRQELAGINKAIEEANAEYAAASEKLESARSAIRKITEV